MCSPRDSTRCFLNPDESMQNRHLRQSIIVSIGRAERHSNGDNFHLVLEVRHITTHHGVNLAWEGKPQTSLSALHRQFSHTEIRKKPYSVIEHPPLVILRNCGYDRLLRKVISEPTHLEVAADLRRWSAMALDRCRSAAATAVMRSSGLWNMRMSTCPNRIHRPAKTTDPHASASQNAYSR